MTAQKSSCSPGPNNYPVPGPGTKHHPAPSAIVFICHTAILRGTGGDTEAQLMLLTRGLYLKLL